MRRGLSAGRVQSVAVRLVVEREREIRAFVPDEYWEISANFTAELAKALEVGAGRTPNDGTGRGIVCHSACSPQTATHARFLSLGQLDDSAST